MVNANSNLSHEIRKDLSKVGDAVGALLKAQQGMYRSRHMNKLIVFQGVSGKIEIRRAEMPLLGFLR